MCITGDNTVTNRGEWGGGRGERETDRQTGRQIEGDTVMGRRRGPSIRNAKDRQKEFVLEF